MSTDLVEPRAAKSPDQGNDLAPGMAPIVGLLRQMLARLDDLAQAIASPPTPRLLLRLDDLADAIGVDRRTIERERSAGRFPRPDLQIGKAPLWKPETIRAWIDGGGRA